MNDSKQDPLLDDLLAGEEAASLRESSLEQMLSSVRQRQRQRQTRRIAVLAAVPALLALALVAMRPTAPVTQLAGNSTPTTGGATARVARVESTSGEEAPVHFISDDELLAMFPGRPVALIGPPGHQQFVFLDQKL